MWEHPDLVELEALEISRDTRWAIWCRVGGREVCIPRGMIFEKPPRLSVGSRCRLVVPRWFADVQGLATSADSEREPAKRA